jgi:hypothetical protein
VNDVPFEPRALQIGKLLQIRKSLQIGKQRRDARNAAAKTSLVQEIFQEIIHPH